MRGESKCSASRVEFTVTAFVDKSSLQPEGALEEFDALLNIVRVDDRVAESHLFPLDRRRRFT